MHTKNSISINYNYFMLFMVRRLVLLHVEESWSNLSQLELTRSTRDNSDSLASLITVAIKP
ncbi:hypothetical protein [Clostridium butyricum]|uniref:hypothetical protein n=1 Tax=Clostridium butyricum TaxID=1492 RepID=UPI001A9A35BE|nr:hypothetical protein [Clostridium butyricum]